MNILQVNSSPRTFAGDKGSHSARLADELVAGLRADNPDARLVVRDLSRNPHPALDEATLDALFTPAEQRTVGQAARVALDDALIAEIQAADVVVLAVPTINFGVTTQFKNWIDAIAKARVTFRYTETGSVEGLLKGKTVYAVVARGGMYRGQPNDHVVEYLKTMLGFLGMTDVRFIYAEGLALGPEAEARGIADARAQLAGLRHDAEAAVA
ncbi:MAG: NAD(P)H-dependent oxidoreductase [Burkholderiales bacterium]|nr:NAD(P)H-dependent oxidoreductase [Burkholderiales bacterium]